MKLGVVLFPCKGIYLLIFAELLKSAYIFITGEMIFRQKLEPTALKVGEAVVLECEIEGDNDNVLGNWYRNDELLMGDIEKNTVLVR